MKNLSLYFLLLIGGLLTPIYEVNASMNRFITKHQGRVERFHIFCSDGETFNRFKVMDLDSKRSYGYKLRPQAYYSNFRDFSNQPEYFQYVWDANHPHAKTTAVELNLFCIGRPMSEVTANGFSQNYMEYCVNARQPKEYCTPVKTIYHEKLNR